MPYPLLAGLTGLALALAGMLAPPQMASEDGQQLYYQLCATCHGDDLTGGNGTSLVDGEWAYGGDRASLYRAVDEGILAQGMPAFGAALSEAEIYEVVDFVLAAEEAALAGVQDAAPQAAPPEAAPQEAAPQEAAPEAAAPAEAPAPAPAEAEVAEAEETAPATSVLPVAFDTLKTLDYDMQAEVFADGLESPWAIDFIDARTALVTEQPGDLHVVEDGQVRAEPVSGTPEVVYEGQGGLLDVAVDPNYAENGWIYLGYSHMLPDAGGERSPAMTRIVRGRLDGNAWTDEEVLFEAPHDTYVTTRHHYGNRIVFDADGHLYFSIGDRGRQDEAQDLSLPNGKVHRIRPDGSIPDDNPFVNHEEALPSIYSYGQRNPQGLVIHPETGELWAVEHGPKGGDELNLVRAGRNYGWPVITYGINYNGTIITEDRAMPGMEQPIVYWRPSIAVSGLDVYDGDLFPYWKGELLVSALAYEEVRLVSIVDGRVIHQEVILKDAGRVREAVTGPDGAIYVVLNEPDQILRLTPHGGV